MAYNIKNLKNRIEEMNGKKPSKKGPPFPQWKPSLAENGQSKTYNVRFLPYSDPQGQPFQEVAYYDNKALSPFRLVAPAQFGMEDPIFNLVSELRKKRNDKSAWGIIKGLLSKPRYFAPLLVREDSSKLAQVWELSPSVCKQIYAILVHEDFENEDVADPLSGFDFTVTVSPSGKTYTNEAGKTYPVNDITIQPRTKPSKLAAKQEDIDKIINSVPDLLEFFKSQVRPVADLEKALEQYLSPKKAASDEGMDDDTDIPSDTDKSVEDQFAGL